MNSDSTTSKYGPEGALPGNERELESKAIEPVNKLYRKRAELLSNEFFGELIGTLHYLKRLLHERGSGEPRNRRLWRCLS